MRKRHWHNAHSNVIRSFLTEVYLASKWWVRHFCFVLSNSIVFCVNSLCHWYVFLPFLNSDVFCVEITNIYMYIYIFGWSKFIFLKKLFVQVRLHGRKMWWAGCDQMHNEGIFAVQVYHLYTCLSAIFTLRMFANILNI